MTETLFDVAQYNSPFHMPAQPTRGNYNKLCQQFCSNSYGLYNELFIDKISEEAHQANHEIYQKLGLKRLLRKCIKKFMLTDLQLVFLSHYLKANQWKVEYDNSINNLVSNQPVQSSIEKQENKLSMILDLNAYFVKSYIGEIQEFISIKEHMNSNDPYFMDVYQNWVLSKPVTVFKITPREINQLYWRYSRIQSNVQKKKDYNDLVSTIIDLSTTYSIIPNIKSNQNNKNKMDYSKNKIISQNKQFQQNQKNKKVDAQNRGFADSDLVKDSFSGSRSREKRKSSMVFDNLHSLSRKSSHQGQAENKEVIQTKQKEMPIHKPVQANKVSLSFKKKQKPNQIVIGFLGEAKADFEDKGRGTPTQNRQNYMSFINLRSNRSSKNNSHLPFLWRPSDEDNFFEKSKFG